MGKQTIKLKYESKWNHPFLKNINKMKTPYQIRIEPEQLEALKLLAKENGTSVNHEIRQAIRKLLNCNGGAMRSSGL